jgi:hypothetical protein
MTDRPNLHLVGGPHAAVNAYGLTAASSRRLAAFLRRAAELGPAELLALAAELERLADAG